MLAILPLFHAYGLTVTIVLPLTEGAAIVIPDRFIPRAILQTIEQHKVTAFVAVPGQYRVLIKEPVAVDASSLRICIAGAERLPDQVALEFRERFHREILQGYGATEVSPVVTVNPPRANHVGSVGRPLPNLQLSIFNENDLPLPANEIGEVCVQGTAVMLGYYNDPAATARKIRDGVLHTEDKGFLDNDGYLHLVGRADDLVKISGEKVYPSEVETALETIDGVDEAAVIAQPDEKHGARLNAFILPKLGATLDEATVRAACRERMEHYKIPRTFTFVQQMPRTATGKTDKRTLATS
jgi:long-chain acyl-CoA synthetase